MASNSSDLCDICEIRNKTSNAIKWCLECEEKLCDECHANHTVSKLLRNHDVINIEQYRKLPQSILEVKNFCGKHNMKFTHLCSQHDVLCCPACTAETGDHNRCITKVLQEVVQTAKTSVLLQSVEETLTNLKDNLRAIIMNRKLNLKNLKDQQREILMQVKKMSEKIIDHLIAFEKNISDELDKKIKINELNLESEIASLEARLQHVETMSKDANTIKQHGSDLQIFVGSKSMENEVYKINNSLQEKVNERNMKQVGFKLQWNTKVNEIIEEISSLGSVLEETLPMSVVLSYDKGKQVHMMQSTPNASIEDISITPKRKNHYKGEYSNVRGCSVFTNGKVIFAVSGNLILCNEYGQKENVIPTSTDPYDVMVIDDNTVAVSTDVGVEVINMTTHTVEKTIETVVCCGLGYYEGSLFCCVAGKGVLSVNLSTNTITTVVKDTIVRGWYYCTVYNDKIFTSRYLYSSVTCYTMDGNKVWEFKDSTEIKYPLGIAVDDKSNVYVASYYNHSIVVLSPDGQKHRTLLTEKDGIDRPSAIHFDRSKNQLLVGNQRGPWFLFSA